MRRIIFIIVLLVAMATNGMAQQKVERQKLNKEDFGRQLERYVALEAQLTSKEAAEFFPVFREMHVKMRKVFDAMKNINRNCANNEKACAEAIRQKDKMDIELKEIQQQYHNKFLRILPACKVMKVINAEDKFHRDMLRRWSKGNHKK
ncbi:MAG: hypothetical protein ACI4B3_02055 [Prevotella sp.]